jgi:hypothetical protein
MKVQARAERFGTNKATVESVAPSKISPASVETAEAYVQ